MYYKQDNPYTPTEDDLENDLHVIDLNADGLYDIVFDGQSGGEPREISIYLNTGDNFENVLTVQQGISKMKFDNGVLSELIIRDWGCCAEILETIKVYKVEENGKFLIFKLLNKFQYIDQTKLPQDFWVESKTVKIVNIDYNIRFSPEINDTTDFYIFGKTVGNIVGKLSKGNLVTAIAESADTTGRVWYFVIINPKIHIKESLFYDATYEEKSFKCGWISSRYVEVKR